MIGRRKRDIGVKRIAAMVLVLAMVITVMPYWPVGIFSIQAEAAEKLSATWNSTNSTLYNSSNDVVTELKEAGT